MDAVQAANSGHPGLPMGMADVATVLFGKFLKFDAAGARLARSRPLRAVRRPRLDAALRAAPSDRLSGHGHRAAASASASSARAPRAIPSTAMRPASRPRPGRSARGSRNAVGMALAERHLRARFGAELVDHRTYVIASDGDLMEGISHEACDFAGHQRLDAADRAVRRQSHHDRRRRLALLPRSTSSSASTAYGWRTARGSTATTRPRSRRRSPRRRTPTGRA